MNIQSHNTSLRKNSVNSSLATVKLLKNQRQVNQTIDTQKGKSKIRFSHQQIISKPNYNQRKSQYKENYNTFNIEKKLQHCLNHQNKEATHVVLQQSYDPLYYCQRCAILIASKGFNVSSLKSQVRKQCIPQRKRNSFTAMNFLKQNQNQNVTRNQRYSGKKQLNYNDNKIKEQQNKVYLNNNLAKQIQRHWNQLKQNRQKSLNEVDICINKLNQNVDQLEDYFYTLHEYIQKFKNIQIKQILRKKQLLQKLRSQTNLLFVQKFMQVKSLKQQLFQFKQCSLQTYNQIINKNKLTNLSLRSNLILPDLDLKIQKNYVHQLGQQIINLIQNYKLNHYPKETHKVNYLQKFKQFTLQEKKDDFCNVNKRFSTKINKQHLNQLTQKIQFKNIQLKDSSSGLKRNKQTGISSKFFVDYYERKNVPEVQLIESKNVESSIRSLQLSFASSQNEDQQIKMESRDNQTLGQYINKGQESSYNTNLLLTSTDF